MSGFVARRDRVQPRISKCSVVFPVLLPSFHALEIFFSPTRKGRKESTRPSPLRSCSCWSWLADGKNLPVGSYAFSAARRGRKKKHYPVLKEPVSIDTNSRNKKKLHLQSGQERPLHSTPAVSEPSFCLSCRRVVKKKLNYKRSIHLTPSRPNLEWNRMNQSPLKYL